VAVQGDLLASPKLAEDEADSLFGLLGLLFFAAQLSFKFLHGG
jgi:hypothetical protein